MNAGDVVSLARVLLQDDGTRWPDSELFGWIDDAQRFVAIVKPDEFVASDTLTLAAGAEQSVASLGAAFDSILRNADGSFVRRVDEQMLRLYEPNWLSLTATATVKQYFADAFDVQKFWVYPPNTGGDIVVRYHKRPNLITSASTDLTIDDSIADAVVDFIVYRAFDKDAEIQENAVRAEAAFAKCVERLGLSNKADAAKAAGAVANG